jgi:Tat protein translocase TatB subunit
MFGIGTSELLVILVVALIVLGPKRLPEVAKTLGKGLAELRKATSGLTDELYNARALIEEEAENALRLKAERERAATRPRDATAAAPQAAAREQSGEQKEHAPTER